IGLRTTVSPRPVRRGPTGLGDAGPAPRGPYGPQRPPRASCTPSRARTVPLQFRRVANVSARYLPSSETSVLPARHAGETETNTVYSLSVLTSCGISDIGIRSSVPVCVQSEYARGSTRPNPPPNRPTRARRDRRIRSLRGHRRADAHTRARHLQRRARLLVAFAAAFSAATSIFFMPSMAFIARCALTRVDSYGRWRTGAAIGEEHREQFRSF
ncbi:MAG: hypothetical protein QOF28_591, partial [Actinomycetota bacterium]|nr:hypothetical protein [Actinomycetota bacterium]